jgi:hypothetical protein
MRAFANPTVIGHRSDNCIGFLVVAQGKLLGPDNKQTAEHRRTPRRERET